MKVLLKTQKLVYNKGNYHFNKKKKKIYSQQSIDIFAKNIVKDLPFMSKYVTTSYNKYILNKYRDKLNRIKNFLNSKTDKVDDLSNAFDKLNFVRIKIMLLERDISAYRNALKNSFDTKDSNRILQKRIHKKYAKLRKFDTYQNLTLGIIYDQSILGEKIKLYESEAKKNSERINKKFDSPENLLKMQKEFIYTIILDRQNKDNVFVEDVDKNILKDLLSQNPKFINSLSNIETFTNEYLIKNPGALSKDFVKFKAEHKKSTINAIVKDYLKEYKTKHPDIDNSKLNTIQKELLSSFTYQDFKKSDIFNSIDLANSANDILLKAKINFAKSEICKELEYCLDLPEINNYFKILENKDRIKNYVVSTERLFVKKIEEEFPEIKTASFIYLYNKVKSLLETYETDIIINEQYFVNDLINAILYNEFPDPQDPKSVKEVLSNISVGIYQSNAAIESKNKFDLFVKLITQFHYIKQLKSLDFEEKLNSSKLFHGVLVTEDLQPILPIDIQTKIINLPYEAQINLARNYHNTSILELLDEYHITDSGELKLGKKLIEFGINSSSSIQRLSYIQQSNKINDYLFINKDNKETEDEYNLAKYILSGIKDNLQEIISATISSEPLPKGNLLQILGSKEEGKELKKPKIFKLKEDSKDTAVKNEESTNSTNEEDSSKNKEVVNYKKAKQYIDIILKETDEAIQAKMLLRIQKRINSKSLQLTDIQIENLNVDLNTIKLSLRSPKAYVDHLVEKYQSEKRDINSLQVGLKLRVRMGYLVLTDDEINAINEAYNFELIQRPTLKTEHEKTPLKMKYKLHGSVDDSTKEKLNNPDALVRNTLKKKSAKISQLDINLFNILNNND